MAGQEGGSGAEPKWWVGGVELDLKWLGGGGGAWLDMSGGSGFGPEAVVGREGNGVGLEAVVGRGKMGLDLKCWREAGWSRARPKAVGESGEWDQTQSGGEGAWSGVRPEAAGEWWGATETDPK